MNRFIPERLSISTLRELYKKGIITPEDVIEEITERAEKTEEYNIWITKPDREKIDVYLKNLNEMDSDLPFWGIPFAVKDNIDVAGMETTAACPEYKYMADENAEVVDRLISMGAIPVGKTNMDQFATGLVGTRSPYGQTHNSLRPELISGGSSSGSAVAVSLGLVSFALGTDTAGSGRVPAALNNIVGYKPPVGAWSTRGLVPACASIDCITVFACDSDDAYTVDSITRGVDKKCRWSKYMPLPKDEKPQKIYILKDPEFYGQFEDEYRSAWERAVKKIESLGIKTEFYSGDIFKKAASILYGGPWVAERWADLREFVKNNGDAVLPVTKTILESSCRSDYDAASVFEAMHALKGYRHEAELLLDNAIIIMPTCGGTWSREEVDNDPFKTNELMGLYTNHCNLLDMAAIALPSDFASDKLPFGITAFSISERENYIKWFSEAFAKTETVEIAVCGLHMRGYALEHQLRTLGADYVRTERTAPEYKMFKLDTMPEKPCLITSEDGSGIEVEIWSIPKIKFNDFLDFLPDELSIGKIHMEDNSEVLGFVGSATENGYGKDVTEFGGWKYIS